jgi:alanine racemase
VTTPRPNAWIELDLPALRRNIALERAALSPHSEIIQVVKANAYGHGMDVVAAECRAAGVKWFMVARIDEALALRKLLPDAHILLMGAVWPDDIDEVVRKGIVPVLASAEQADGVAAEARRRGLTIRCHAKIDTGMGRLGMPWQEAAALLGRRRAAGGLEIGGVCMHFASADEADDAFALEQWKRFEAVQRDCRSAGFTGLFRHVSNSAAFGAHPEWDLDGVRFGILTYGYGGRRAGRRAKTQPFLHWKTRVVQVKHVPRGFPVSYLGTHVTERATWLATLDAGYSDGLSRMMSNRGEVLVGGRRAGVAGRVTMDFTVVDVGPEGGVREGDEAVLIGRQGEASLWADEVARWCRTIPYEILTSIRSPGRTVSP